MKNSVVSIVLITLAGLSTISVASTPVTSAEAAKSLNAESEALLGVSLQAVSLLFLAKPGTLLLKDSLMQDGSWLSLQALERAGYVKNNLIAAEEGEFVQVSLTTKGQQVVEALRSP
jgi:hypothetical protein